MDTYQQLIAASRYARYLPPEKRRETWEETVSRYFTFFESYLQKMHKYKMTDKLQKQLKEYVLSLVAKVEILFLLIAIKMQ